MNFNNTFPTSDNNKNHNDEIINQVDITQNQFNAYKERKTEPVSYNEKDKKNNSYILPYLFLVAILVILTIIAVAIFIGRR